MIIGLFYLKGMFDFIVFINIFPGFQAEDILPDCCFSRMLYSELRLVPDRDLSSDWLMALF